RCNLVKRSYLFNPTNLNIFLDIFVLKFSNARPLSNLDLRRSCSCVASSVAHYLGRKVVPATTVRTVDRAQSDLADDDIASDVSSESDHEPVDSNEVFSDLANLHHRILQQYCHYGPGFPLTYLCHTRDEWVASFASGPGCRYTMVTNIRQFHNANIESEKFNSHQRKSATATNGSSATGAFATFDEIIGSLWQLHSLELRQFCSTGKANWPYSELHLTESECNASFDEGTECKGYDDRQYPPPSSRARQMDIHERHGMWRIH
ncbi:Hypothetical protein, putative, partial [Bodo saltans]